MSFRMFSYFCQLTYKVKVGVIRGGHITSSCTVIATYDDSVGLIDWEIPSECHDF